MHARPNQDSRGSVQWLFLWYSPSSRHQAVVYCGATAVVTRGTLSIVSRETQKSSDVLCVKQFCNCYLHSGVSVSLIMVNLLSLQLVMAFPRHKGRMTSSFTAGSSGHSDIRAVGIYSYLPMELVKAQTSMLTLILLSTRQRRIWATSVDSEG